MDINLTKKKFEDGNCIKKDLDGAESNLTGLENEANYPPIIFKTNSLVSFCPPAFALIPAMEYRKSQPDFQRLQP